jgi:hypothetical protein
MYTPNFRAYRPGFAGTGGLSAEPGWRPIWRKISVLSLTIGPQYWANQLVGKLGYAAAAGLVRTGAEIAAIRSMAEFAEWLFFDIVEWMKRLETIRAQFEWMPALVLGCCRPTILWTIIQRTILTRRIEPGPVAAQRFHYWFDNHQP